jgi:hypothetical protein
MPFTIFYELPEHSPGGKPVSVTVDTAYEAWDQVERLGRDNRQIVDIKDPVGHSITGKDLQYRTAREAH